MKGLSYLDCHLGAAFGASISARFIQENRDMRWLCAMLLGAGVGVGTLAADARSTGGTQQVWGGW